MPERSSGYRTISPRFLAGKVCARRRWARRASMEPALRSVLCILAQPLCEFMQSAAVGSALWSLRPRNERQGGMIMAMASAASAATSGPPTPQALWSEGDYDRLASYASAAEAARLIRFAG